MRRKGIGFIGSAGAGMMAVLALLGGGMRSSIQAPTLGVGSNKVEAANNARQSKATIVQGQTNAYVRQEEIGGVPFVRYMPNYGMSPRDYGMSLGRTGSGKKSNRNRYSHNAKLKRRGVC